MSPSAHPERDESRFLDLVRRGARLTYATRCRLVGDEVRRQEQAPDPLATCTRLDGQLAALAAMSGTMAELLLKAAGADRRAELSMAELRGWTLERVRPTDAAAWAAGAASQPMWLLLMAPVPADDEELGWLALTAQVGQPGLQKLTTARSSA